MKNMIRIFIILFIPLFSSQAQVKKTPVFSLVYKDSNNHHKYILIKDSGHKDSYTLRFIDGKKVKNTKLSSYQSRNLQSYANHVTWNSEFRRPSTQKNCTAFANLKSKTASTIVCKEDSINTGKTLGLLNELHRISK